MGLGGCYSILKYLLVLLNIVFLILGCAGIVFGVWMLVDPTFSFSITQDYIISVVIILIASIVLVVVAIFGIYGALGENQCALITFFSLLLIIFVAEISAGFWVYVNSASLEVQVENAVRMTVEQEYAQNENRKLLFDTFQRNLHCCGSEVASDWAGTKQINAAVSSDTQRFNIPQSCCREGVSEEMCLAKTRGIIKTDDIDYNVIYNQGCYSLIMAKLREHSCLILSIGIAVAVSQFLGLIFALILAFAVNRSNRYKA